LCAKNKTIFTKPKIHLLLAAKNIIVGTENAIYYKPNIGREEEGRSAKANW
jgi:hypothetical protein